MPEDFELDVGLVANIDDLEKQIESGDFEANVDIEGGDTLLGTQPTGGGGGLGSGVGAGAGASGLLGGMSATLTAILGAITAAVGFLASLQPIQSVVGGIFRQIELFTAQIISVVSPVLNSVNKFMQKIFQVLRNPKEFFSTLINNLKTFVSRVVNSVIGGINQVPGVNIPTVSTNGYQSFGGGDRYTSQGRSTRQGSANQVGGGLTALAGAGLSISPLALAGAGGYFLLNGLSDEGKDETAANETEGFLEGLF